MGTAEGISAKMLEVYLLMQAAKLFAVVPHEGYLPYDKSGDWFYQVVESVQFALIGYLLYEVKYGSCKNQYHREHDTFPLMYLIIPSAVLAIFFHSTLNKHLASDVMWAFALNLESVAGL